MTDHTPTPWFVSGVRFRMNGGEWQSINRYDEALKRDENVACVGYDSRTGLGQADAHFIVKAVNNHDALMRRVAALELIIAEEVNPFNCRDDLNRMLVEEICNRIPAPVSSPSGGGK